MPSIPPKSNFVDFEFDDDDVEAEEKYLKDLQKDTEETLALRKQEYFRSESTYRGSLDAVDENSRLDGLIYLSDYDNDGSDAPASPPTRGKKGAIIEALMTPLRSTKRKARSPGVIRETVSETKSGSNSTPDINKSNSYDNDVDADIHGDEALSTPFVVVKSGPTENDSETKTKRMKRTKRTQENPSTAIDQTLDTEAPRPRRRSTTKSRSPDSTQKQSKSAGSWANGVRSSMNWSETVANLHHVRKQFSGVDLFASIRRVVDMTQVAEMDMSLMRKIGAGVQYLQYEVINTHGQYDNQSDVPCCRGIMM